MVGPLDQSAFSPLNIAEKNIVGALLPMLQMENSGVLSELITKEIISVVKGSGGIVEMAVRLTSVSKEFDYFWVHLFLLKKVNCSNFTACSRLNLENI